MYVDPNRAATHCQIFNLGGC